MASGYPERNPQESFFDRLSHYLDNGPDPSWEDRLTAFAEKHHALFASHEGEEHRHQYHESYMEFISINDEVVKGFLAQERMSDAEFEAACQRALAEESSRSDDSRASSPNAHFVRAFFAGMEYESFLRFMFDFVNEQLESSESGQQSEYIPDVGRDIVPDGGDAPFGQ